MNSKSCGTLTFGGICSPSLTCGVMAPAVSSEMLPPLLPLAPLLAVETPPSFFFACSSSICFNSASQSGNLFSFFDRLTDPTIPTMEPTTTVSATTEKAQRLNLLDRNTGYLYPAPPRDRPANRPPIPNSARMSSSTVRSSR